MHWLQIVLGGWYESNHYALRRPKDNNVRICQCVQPPVVEEMRNTIVDIPLAKPCSTLNLRCFNYQCFTGSDF